MAAPLNADTIAVGDSEEGDPAASVELSRPTDAENLARLLFYFQFVDKLRKAGYRESLGFDSTQTALAIDLAHAIDTLNAEAQGAPDEEASSFDERYDALTARLDRELRQTLSREQFNAVRVELLEAQIGATAFLMPGVPETIGLSDAQIAKISASIEAHKEELRPRNFTLWNIRKVIALGRQLRAQAETLLRAEQKERWGRVMSGSLVIAD